MQGIIATITLWTLERLAEQSGSQSDRCRRGLTRALAVLSRVRDDILQEGLDGMVGRAERRGETIFARIYVTRIQELLQDTSREEQEQFFQVVATGITQYCREELSDETLAGVV
jgi:hypothetical protein